MLRPPSLLMPLGGSTGEQAPHRPPTTRSPSCFLFNVPFTRNSCPRTLKALKSRHTLWQTSVRHSVNKSSHPVGTSLPFPEYASPPHHPQGKADSRRGSPSPPCSLGLSRTAAGNVLLSRVHKPLVLAPTPGPPRSSWEAKMNRRVYVYTGVGGGA